MKSTMKLATSNWLQTRIMLPLIALVGLLIAVVIIKSTPEMTHSAMERPSIPVNFINVEQHTLQPEIIGFGTVAPDLDLQAKAEVTGRIVYVHPGLKKGEILPKGTLLLKIDDKDYLLQIKQAEADLLVNQANLSEMRLSIGNNQLELSLSLEKLKVRENEYNRKQKLSKTGAVSQSSLSAERQNLLQQKQEVQQLTNKKTTLPSQLKVMEARLAIAQAKLEKYRRDLHRTQVKIPFDGRISQVYAELDQYVSTGSALFDAVGLEKIIINAQFPLDQFRLFAQNFNRDNFQVNNVNQIPNMSSILSAIQITAKVDEASGDFTSWTGKVERFSDDIDPKSRTVGVIISVKDSYRQMSPGNKPPLLQGMYMQVTLQGKATDFMAIPRFSLHQGDIYTIASDDTLRRIALEEMQYKGGLILLKSTLSIGDRVITSDVFPAVEGMSVTPILDKNTQSQMELWLETTP